jgi:hypothetical protein
LDGGSGAIGIAVAGTSQVAHAGLYAGGAERGVWAVPAAAALDLWRSQRAENLIHVEPECQPGDRAQRIDC